MRIAAWSVAIVGAAAIAWLAARVAPARYAEELGTPFPHRDAAWTGSATCRSCHPDHHASWHRTFHRTMTQEAGPETVLGAFDGREVTYWGVTARPVRRGDEFFIEYLDESGAAFNSLAVKRTVGSRRYQQYLVTADDDEPGTNYYRVPLLWHIEEERWIHLNGAFLGDDDADYDQHVTVWNQTCIFCHNTGPEPGLLNFDDLTQRAARGEAVQFAWEGRFDSHVAELGVACEACHAPAAEHAKRNRDPVRRYVLHAADTDDPTIVNPSKLHPTLSVEVCGQCHGQRLPDPPGRIRDFLETGPAFRPGERLVDSVHPLTPGSPDPSGREDGFRPRFWGDGTPRLTAYEYQGLVSSPCFLEGGLTCISCHSMHDGDPRGQLTEAMRTSAACSSCHADIVASPEAHTHHGADSPGSSCYACHMPKAVYGILEIHRSHRIENPDAARAAEAGRPNACTNCHLDRSLGWAAEATREWWNEDAREPAFRGDGAPLALADVAASLLAGDPVQRAVAARVAGRDDSPLSIEERAFLWPLLIQALRDDYPAIRWFARRSLLALDAERAVPGARARLESFDYIGPAAQRRSAVDALDAVWAASDKGSLPPPPASVPLDASFRLLPDRITPLLALQSDRAIEIGE